MIGKGGKGEPTKEESKADVKAEEKPTTNGNRARAGDESPMDQDAATNGDVKEAGADADADADVAAPEVNGAPG